MNRFAKTFAHLPSTSSKTLIKRLISVGMNVARVKFLSWNP